MKARSSKIKHPSGIVLETPLLVPSYSSKGFSMDKDGVSEIKKAMLLCREFLHETSLVSAYDLYYNHIIPPEEFVSTEVVFIDSGGYETSQLYDLSGINKRPINIKEWSSEFLEKMLANWPERYPAVIVNYDHGEVRVSMEDQIKEATAFFGKHVNKLSDFLIKPETLTQDFIPVPEIIAKISSLTFADIIGFTEKELGSSIIKRMKHIYEIRTALDEAGIDKPIHIFGCLEPISTILYFLSGAEIFDGLTWLKYSYMQGKAIYVYNFGALNHEIGIYTSDEQVRTKSLLNNIYFLDKMKYIMKNFVASRDYSSFDEFGGNGFGNFIEQNFTNFINNINN